MKLFHLFTARTRKNKKNRRRTEERPKNQKKPKGARRATKTKEAKKSTKTIGNEGEDRVLNMLSEVFGAEWDIKKVSGKSQNCDIQMRHKRKDIVILIESKNHQGKIREKETEKFERDIRVNSPNAGIMVSLHSGYCNHTKPFRFCLTNGVPCVYISSLLENPSALEYAVICLTKMTRYCNLENMSNYSTIKDMIESVHNYRKKQKKTIAVLKTQVKSLSDDLDEYQMKTIMSLEQILDNRADNDCCIEQTQQMPSPLPSPLPPPSHLLDIHKYIQKSNNSNRQSPITINELFKHIKKTEGKEEDENNNSFTKQDIIDTLNAFGIHVYLKKTQKRSILEEYNERTKKKQKTLSGFIMGWDMKMQ